MIKKLNQSPGFSLIELLVVLAIMGMAFAVISPSLGNVIETSRIKNAARELAARLRETRSLAINRQQETTFSLDVENASYIFMSVPRTLNIPGETKITLTTAESEQESHTQGAIRFFADGSSTGGRISLQNQRQHYTVDVNWLTGRITIFQ